MLEEFQEFLTTDPVHADVVNAKIITPGNKLVDFVSRPYSADVIGIEWDASQKTPKLRWIDGAGRYIAALPSDYFDKHAIFDRRRCIYVRDSGEIIVGEDGRGTNLFDDQGFAKESFGYNDSEYDVLVQKPKFYGKFASHYPYYRWWVSAEPHAGFEIWPTFRQRYPDIGSLNGAPVPIADHWYDGAYEAYGYVDSGEFKLGSQPGRRPVTGNSGTDDSHADWDPYPGLVDDNVPDISLGRDGEFIINIAEKCAGLVGDGFGITNFWNYAGDQLLMYIEYGTLDLQTALGKGIVDLSSGNKFAGKYTGADDINSRLADNGTGVGSGVDGKTPVTWRGIENPYGNVWKFIIGCNFKSDGIFRTINRDGTGTLAGTMGAGSYEEGEGRVPTSNGYVSGIMEDELGGLAIMPSEAKGSDSTYFCDYWYYNSGDRILLAGGRWSHGRAAGPGFRHAAYDVTSSARYHGTRLELRKPEVN